MIVEGFEGIGGYCDGAGDRPAHGAESQKKRNSPECIATAAGCISGSRLKALKLGAALHVRQPAALDGARSIGAVWPS